MYVCMSVYRCMYVSAKIKCVCVGTCVRAACMHAFTFRILLFVLRHKDICLRHKEIVSLTAKDTTDDACHYTHSVVSAFCWGCVPVTLCNVELRSCAMWICAVLVTKP